MINNSSVHIKLNPDMEVILGSSSKVNT